MWVIYFYDFYESFFKKKNSDIEYSQKTKTLQLEFQLWLAYNTYRLNYVLNLTFSKF